MLGRKEGTYYNFIFLIVAALFLYFPNLINVRVYPDVIVKTEFLISLFLVSLISYSFEDIKTEYHKGMRARQADLEEEK